MALLRPYGSVTVLNGHIHQVLQKVEGNVALHTAMSLAYPLPTPGQAGIGEPGPGDGAGRRARQAARHARSSASCADGTSSR